MQFSMMCEPLPATWRDIQSQTALRRLSGLAIPTSIFSSTVAKLCLCRLAKVCCLLPRAQRFKVAHYRLSPNLLQLQKMDRIVRNLEQAYRELRARAVLKGRTVGELITQAIRGYLIR